MNRWLRIAPFVEAALRDHRPVVALETTVVTHGLPHPRGFELAGELEAEVIRHGAVPATIGVLDGAVHVGLSRDELARLAGSPAVAKLNLSNLGAQVAAGAPGSTTVAATMFVASRCGIRVFATGGIGGVHRGEAESGDVSADLTALSRFPVAVVCAGAKAVLDLPRTVEALETLGVPVFGWRTDRFPAFWRRDTDLPVDRRFDDLDVLAGAAVAHWGLGADSGVLVVNPVPAEAEMDGALYEQALAQALSDAMLRGASGRDVTPFLLDRMRELTGGASVDANLALLRHNARVAADLAAAIEGARGI